MTEDIWCWLPFFVLLGLMAGASSMERRDPLPWYLRYAPAYAAAAAAFIALAPNPIAAVSTNLGAVYQAQADLSSSLSAKQKEEYLEQAGRHFQRSLTYQPDQIGANYRLGLIALEKYDFQQAIQYFQQAHPEGSGHTGLNKALGLAYTFSGRLEEGTPLLKDQIDIIKELNYWGWYFGTIQKLEASQNAYTQADRIECER
jgi:tetratricopeptide (TPR) repeat protein